MPRMSSAVARPVYGRVGQSVEPWLCDMNRKTGPFIDDCEFCAHRGRAVVCDLVSHELAEFRKAKHSLRFDSHQTVFYEGHVSFGLYVLCTGRVKLTRSSTRGRRQIVRILGHGELIEKHAFRANALHEVTCETMEPSQVCVIEKDRYLSLIQRNPQLAIKLLQLLSTELGMNIDRLNEFTFKTARERLAGLLLEMGRRFGMPANEGVLIGMVLKREEIAELAGISAETAIRMLYAMRDEKIIAIDGRTITLLNSDRLAKIAGH
jgi:CRP-like cAMP-binding protein